MPWWGGLMIAFAVLFLFGTLVWTIVFRNKVIRLRESIKNVMSMVRIAKAKYLQVLRKVDTAQRGTINAQGDAYRNANHTGNGRSTRIWLDLILKKRLKKCTDWSKIDKKAYLSAVQESPVDSTDIFNLIKNALTEDIDNREIFMKGIDYSYYYEQVNE